MSTLALRKGVASCVCDSLIRDCKKIMAMGFSAFHVGIRPVDSKGRGRVTAYDVPARCGKVLVHPGDLVYADFDGVVVVPGIFVTEVLSRAAENVSKENATRRELLKGRTLRKVCDEYRVL